MSILALENAAQSQAANGFALTLQSSLGFVDSLQSFRDARELFKGFHSAEPNHAMQRNTWEAFTFALLHVSFKFEFDLKACYMYFNLTMFTCLWELKGTKGEAGIG